ncbi:MAG TPA: 2'-5' RNA ligase family protein, partial [Armatimonadota bacterium]|nr:2'-5' RNA ligase family protein [Armatimonadota bacterium]
MSALRTYAVSSDLDSAAREQVLALWAGLERRFGLTRARAAIWPHVTYVVGQTNRPQELLKKVSEVAEEVSPFPVEIDGVGVFPGEWPVLFLRCAKSPALLRAYERLLQVTAAVADVWPHYTPAYWTPHITLAL